MPKNTKVYINSARWESPVVAWNDIEKEAAAVRGIAYSIPVDKKISQQKTRPG